MPMRVLAHCNAITTIAAPTTNRFSQDMVNCDASTAFITVARRRRAGLSRLRSPAKRASYGEARRSAGGAEAAAPPRSRSERKNIFLVSVEARLDVEIEAGARHPDAIGRRGPG